MKIGPSPEKSLQIPSGNAASGQKTGQAAPAMAAATSNAAQTTRSAGVAVTVSTMARGLEKAARSDVADIDSQKVASGWDLRRQSGSNCGQTFIQRTGNAQPDKHLGLNVSARLLAI